MSTQALPFPFDRVGLHGFQLIQDRLPRRTHHSNPGVHDHIVIDDLMQAEDRRHRYCPLRLPTCRGEPGLRVVSRRPSGSD